MDEDTIEAIEVQDTDFGMKVVLQSPFDAKDFIKVLPWKKMSEEVSENGSLREKAVSRGMSEDNVAIKAAEDFEFSDDFATHASWDPDAISRGEGAWTIDRSSWDEAQEFFEFVGFDTSVRANVNL